MASIEFIEKRITGKEKEIEKLTKKLERIEKAKATNWEVNPYYYDERELKYTTRDLEEAKAALAKYQTELQTAKEKAASRNVQVIIDFLEMWKETNRKFFQEQFTEYVKDKAKHNQEDQEYCDWWNHGGFRDPNRKEIEAKRRESEKNFNAKWSFITPYIKWEQNKETFKYEWVFDLDKLNKDLDQEANAKYDFIIERTNAIVGTIKDTMGLKIGAKGDLNGYIIGDRGTAKVQTIGAGGYNIQCFHFRTLIHEGF